MSKWIALVESEIAAFERRMAEKRLNQAKYRLAGHKNSPAQRLIERKRLERAERSK